MLYGIQNLMKNKIKIDKHFNSQVNIDNYNIIKNHPNLIILI